jgi:hypothetical protein
VTDACAPVPCLVTGLCRAIEENPSVIRRLRPLRLVPRLLLLAVAIAASFSVVAGAPPAVRAANGYPVFATVATDHGVKLRSKPGSHKYVATLAAGTELEVLAGPDSDGWYKVKAAKLPKAKRGWIQADRIAINQFVRAASDLDLSAGPGDGEAVSAWVRHGVVLSVVGPGRGDFLFVRYGDTVGYAYAPALTVSDGPATDPSGERWVDVNRSTSDVHLMIGETVVDTFQASLGRDQGEGFYATASGTYSIYSKVEGLSYTPYANAYIEYWAGFDPERDNGFHAWTMDANGNVIDGGWGPTGGCVATRPEDAAVIFNFVDIGTRVEIHR